MVGGAVDDLLERVSGDHVRVVDLHKGSNYITFVLDAQEDERRREAGCPQTQSEKSRQRRYPDRALISRPHLNWQQAAMR